MFVRLLGAVGVGAVPDRVVRAPGRVATSVLVELILARGRRLTIDALVEVVWEHPTASARNAVQVAVSKLRKLFGADFVAADRVGYWVPTALLRVDLFEVEQLVTDAADAQRSGRFVDAEQLARSAVALFDGTPLDGVVGPGSESVRAAADRLRGEAVVMRGQALLRLDRAAEAIRLLQEHADAEPFDEPTRASLLEALLQSGRWAEGLRAYEEFRVLLDDELGVDPSPEVQRVFQRLLAGPSEKPAAADGRSTAAGTTRLPSELGVLRGREDELERVVEVVSSGHRLIAVLGPGGIGKTRLAVAAARRLVRQTPRPAYYLDLSAAADRPLTDAARAAFDGRPAAGSLVVLDGADLLVDELGGFIDDLADVDGLQVLVTSRTALRLRAEWQLWVEPLSVASPDGPAVALLADRAGMSTASRAAVAAELRVLAERVAGVPLALELMGSALRWEPLAELVGRLPSELILLADDARDRTERHVSVAASIEWSLSRATPELRAALGRLTVIKGTFGLDVARRVLAADQETGADAALVGLVERSLLQRLADPGEVWFRMLEPVRLQALASPSVPAPDRTARLAHAEYYLGQAAAANWSVEAHPVTGRQQGSVESNLRTALEWSWEHAPDLALNYVGGLFTPPSPGPGAVG